MNQLPTRRFFVVIHTLRNGRQHAIGEAALAKDAGADGVFLIPDYAKGDKRATTEDQFEYIQIVKESLPGFLIGANFLVSPKNLVPQLYVAPPDLYQSDSNSMENIERSKLRTTEFFLAVAFKYSKYVTLTGDALRQHCDKVSAIADVPTTSGTATGVEADIAKIREIRSYLPTGKRLGIASGVTEQNVTTYLKEGVTDFLIATSLIENVDEASSADILSYSKVVGMAEIIHGYRD